MRDGHGHGGATAMPLAAESRSRSRSSDVGQLAHWTTSSPLPLTGDPSRFRRKTWRRARMNRFGIEIGIRMSGLSGATQESDFQLFHVPTSRGRSCAALQAKCEQWSDIVTLVGRTARD